MIGRSLALPVSLLIGAVLVGISPGLVVDVHATPVTAFTCTATAPPGQVVIMPCMAPGATVCEVSASHPISVSAAGVNGVGKAVCRNASGAAEGTGCGAGEFGSSCTSVCPSTCFSPLIHHHFRGVLATCVANAQPPTGMTAGMTTATCTIFEK
jgi:hypothetical protein